MSSRRAAARAALLALGTAALLAPLLRAAPAFAQPMAGGMPDLRAISGRPLPDRGMPPGMVTVRVARKTPASPVAGAEVTALIENPGGETRKRTAKADADGRATFEGVPAGQRFHAEVVVDGEKLSTETFPMPDTGGIRTMLLAGLPPPGAPGEGGGGAGGAKTFSLGVISGFARLDAALPAGTVDVLAVDQAGHPLANQKIELGKVAGGGQNVEVMQQVTGPDGRARFSQVAGGAAAGGAGGAGGGVAAAVVMARDGLRLGTDGFQVPSTGPGISVELHALERSADPSLITVGAGGRIILQLRDDALGFIETLPLENHSDKLFDPGPGGVEIPLPSEAYGAEGAEGEHKIEIRKGIGVAVHGPIPPRRPETADAHKSPDEVTFGFLLPSTSSVRSFEQRFPNGLGEFTFITEQVPNLVIDSDQISGRQARELQGKKYWLMRGAPVPPGGVLRFTIRGLPAPDNTGRVVSAGLALLLVGGAVVFGRKRGGGAATKAASERERLVDRREHLFSDLVKLEASRAANGAPASDDAARRSKTERDELVRRLEGVYRELAAVDERRAV